MIPIGDDPRRHTFPLVTLLLLGANLAVFAYELSLGSRQLERFFAAAGTTPLEILSGRDLPPAAPVSVYATLITAMFIHGGLLHIGSNMLFLWVFGDNVEDRFGHVAYLGFYLASGIVASLAQASIDPSSVVPVVGASGAVAGVLGAYLVWFPKATISVVIPFFVLIFIPLPVPAIVMIGLWFLQNLLAGYATIGSAGTPDAGVAFFAHIGGFIFGFALVLLLFRNLRAARRAPPPAW